MKRLDAVKTVNVPFPDWATERTKHIILLAQKMFDVQYAALSFFDSKHEIVRVEHGYSKGLIPRSVSIGAHALLSHDPMVVLDTAKVSKVS
jgi:hypothetical protein